MSWFGKNVIKGNVCLIVIENILSIVLFDRKKRNKFAIADVAVRKCHQWLDEIWIICTHTSYSKSAKVFSRKLCHAIYAVDTCSYAVDTCSLHSIRARLLVRAFCTAYACYKCGVTDSFSCINNFADILYGVSKK